MGYRWNYFVSNQRLLRETESRTITSIVRQRQLKLYGHVARYPEADPACLVVSEKDKLELRRPRCSQNFRGRSKLIILVLSYLVWEGDLHGDLRGLIACVSKGGRGDALLGVCPQ